MDFSISSIKSSLEAVASRQTGISSAEATARLKKYGENELKASNKWGFIKKFLEPFTSAFVIMLVVGGFVSVLVGHKEDAVIIAVVVGINALIEWGQQISASRVLASLKRYGAKTVKVRRSGSVEEIDSKLLVPGDIVLVAAGEKISADGRIISAQDLTIDESSLTGESLPINKTAAALPGKREIYQQVNMLFSGTLALSGRGEYCVTATGNHTQIGHIAKLATSSNEPPPIVKKIRKLTFQLVVGTLAIAAVTVLLGILRGNPPLEMLRFAVALMVSVIPEGLPVTLTVILLLGIRRMAAKKAFVRKLQAVETLGMVTAIATDKTGTLTKNQIGIAETWDLDGSLSTEDNTDFWLSVSHKHPDLQHPIERAITTYTESKAAAAGWTEILDLPFDTERRYTTVLWQKDSDGFVVYLKGAPEVILAGCKLSPSELKKLNAQLDKMATSMRVIAVAKKHLVKKPADLKHFHLNGLHFEGLIGFKDELRTEAKAAVAATKSAGINVYMLTGDRTDTAYAIASEVGIVSSKAEVAEFDGKKSLDSNLGNWLKTKRAFGRVLPEYKFKILENLKKTEITAMTGDGVNDAPALTKSDVGLAMGSGTDAAKEAADIVLLDDNYATIISAIREGRTIYANVRKMIYYQLSTNLAEAVVVVGGLLVGLPLVMTAAQVLWLNLVTDTTMIIPLGLEPAEPRQMQLPPRRPKESLFSNHLFSRLLLTVIVMAIFSLAAFVMFNSESLELARTMAFLSLCVVQWASAFNSRSEDALSWQAWRQPNFNILVGIGIGALLIGLAIFGPLQKYMGTASVNFYHAAWLLMPFIATILVSDIHKLLTRNK